ncbi:MAG: hypothetical protein LBG06_04085 [Deltaproteobacteria bacterium]|jgi:urease accessory protein|nr:hypothetical protein [Deltaproteobacteria bacterium]
MIKFTENLGPLPGPDRRPELPLDSAARRRTRQLARLADGREAALLLPRGAAPGPGDVLRGPGGELAMVAAAPEPLSEARAADPGQLARAAYHLGNRHAELELDGLSLRFPADPVLEDLARGLGLSVAHLNAPFRPEGGAYVPHGSGHGRESDGQGHDGGGDGHGYAHDYESDGRRLPRGTGAASRPAPAALLRLLFAASPARPTGAFAWSGGLASYVDAGEVRDAAGLYAWITDAVRLSLASCDLPLLKRCFLAAVARDPAAFARWNAVSLASRGTRELLLGEREMGGAVVRMLVAGGLLAGFPGDMLQSGPGYVAAYGLMGAALGLGEGDAPSLLTAFLWGAVESLAVCASKSVPLGQGAVQGVLLGLLGLLPGAVDAAMALGDGELGVAAPLLAIRSSAHEESPLRMYRS